MALRLGRNKANADTTVVTTTEPVTNVPNEDQFADLIPDNLPRKRRGPSPAVLGGAIAALTVAAVGAGAKSKKNPMCP